MTTPLLSIVIPAHDEAGNLPALLDEISTALPDTDYEVLVVDDASRDDSWDLLTRRARQDPRLRPLHHAHSAGQSTSVWQAAHAARGTWLATLDGDGQNDPADLPSLLARARQGDVTLVAGQRVNRRDDWLKRLSSRVANRVRAALLADDTPDTGCGIKVIQRRAFLTLPYFDHMHRFLPALIQMQGGRCVSVPVNHRPRGTGKSHYGLNNRLWAGLVDMLGVMWLRKRSRLPAPVEGLRDLPGLGDSAPQSAPHPATPPEGSPR
ncbi:MULTISPECIES: glycosyltransferase family 2 protein [Modicisalibacter]|uniref:glycosyltransferase family 2 protein n=1 Tax=Modicisalibacter TaxID=574347 RepID=UPI00100A3D28|nr:glycosyltransferase family 2 protein [Halomonas coralii]MBZ9559795.1 glycosyltransferase family 2 protein [Modicisalibacter sp. R2A 31.J]MBZ9577247.1 glycosyltransferase family 2 protein [Modicisalibacter sp. MOD 31.J]